jgi:hypothetical protein
MLARFSQTDNLMRIGERTAKTCLMVPNAVDDLGPVLQLTEQAVAGTEQHVGYRWFLLTKGMADYRTGHFAAAIDALNKAVSQRDPRYSYSSEGAGTAFLFLAMAHHQLGNADHARQALEQARLVVPRYTKIGWNKNVGSYWRDWLMFQIVRHEAEQLVQSKTRTAGETVRPSNVLTGPASSRRLVCTPGPIALYFYRRPAPQTRRPQAMLLYTPNQGLAGPVGVALAGLALLALDPALARSGFQAPLAFDAGSNPVSAAVGDFNRDGILDLVVANHDSNNVSVLFGKGDGTFAAAVNYAAGIGPSAVAVADVNSDGVLDLMVANMTSRSVSVLLGNGDGTFQAAIDYPAGGALSSVAVADFNGDGKPDLAVANASRASVSLFLGNGDGTFQPAASFSAGPAPSSVAVGDFNRDGILDLVVTNNVQIGTVSVLLGKGDGTFGAAAKFTAGSEAIDVAVSDLNGDGILDLAVASAGSNRVSVLLGNGDGTFQAARQNGAGKYPAASVAVGDFNGDGIPDLVVATMGGINGLHPGSLAVFIGNGDGTFQASVSYAAGESTVFVAVADLNGDGKADLAVANSDGNNVTVLLGKGDSSLQPAPTYSAGIIPMGLAVGDFNGDGIPDLAVANFGGPPPPPVSQGTVSILLGNGDGTFRAAVDYQTGRNASGVAVGDFNGDGFLDLAVTDSADNDVSVLLGNGDGTFRPAVTYRTGDFPAWLVVADFNGDGIPDLAVANAGSSGSNPTPGMVSILLGKGDGSFLAAVNYTVGTEPWSLAVGDFNGDGIPDLVVAISEGLPSLPNVVPSGSVAVLLGNGDGTFQAAAKYAADLNPTSVGVGDFNGDGILDLAVANFLSNDVSVLLGNGDGTFQAAVNYPIGAPLWPQLSVLVRDFNGDGILDLAVVSDSGVRVLLGNGDGTFRTTPITYVPGGHLYGRGLAVGDFNGDGLPDIAVTNGSSNNISILLNDGKWAP